MGGGILSSQAGPWRMLEVMFQNPNSSCWRETNKHVVLEAHHSRSAWKRTCFCKRKYSYLLIGDHWKPAKAAVSNNHHQERFSRFPHGCFILPRMYLGQPAKVECRVWAGGCQESRGAKMGFPQHCRPKQSESWSVWVETSFFGVSIPSFLDMPKALLVNWFWE